MSLSKRRKRVIEKLRYKTFARPIFPVFRGCPKGENGEPFSNCKDIIKQLNKVNGRVVLGDLKPIKLRGMTFIE